MAINEDKREFEHSFSRPPYSSTHHLGYTRIMVDCRFCCSLFTPAIWIMARQGLFFAIILFIGRISLLATAFTRPPTFSPTSDPIPDNAYSEIFTPQRIAILYAGLVCILCLGLCFLFPQLKKNRPRSDYFLQHKKISQQLEEPSSNSMTDGDGNVQSPLTEALEESNEKNLQEWVKEQSLPDTILIALHESQITTLQELQSLSQEELASIEILLTPEDFTLFVTTCQNILHLSPSMTTPNPQRLSRPSIQKDRETQGSVHDVIKKVTATGHSKYIQNVAFPDGNLLSHPSRRVDKLLRHAIRHQNISLFEKALSLDADPNLRTTLAYTILHEAIAMRCKVGFVKYLVDRYPEFIEARTSHGTTPLMQAIATRQLPIAQLLLQRNAIVNVQNDLGQTPLMVGAIANNEWAASLLLAWDADPDIVDCNGRRAVDLALLSGNARVASDLHGSALAVVPGYIAPKVQTTKDATQLIYTIAWHAVDITTDILLAQSLLNTGHPLLGGATYFFLFLPSLFIVLIPYQTILERVLTICQLRIVYEGLISMGEERLTVRFGATKMYHTILQNIPQTFFQAFIAVLVFFYHGSSIEADVATLIFSIMSTLYQATTTFHGMYIMRFFIRDNDSSTQKWYIRIGAMVGIVFGMILRIVMWVSCLLVFKISSLLLFLWVFLTRFRLIGIGNTHENDRVKLNSTIVDLFATYLTDMSFITHPQCFLMSLILSISEIFFVLIICIPVTKFHRGPYFGWIFVLISFFLIWFCFCLSLILAVHGSYAEMPNLKFVQELFNLSKLIIQLKNLFYDSITGIVTAVTVLYLELTSSTSSPNDQTASNICPCLNGPSNQSIDRIEMGSKRPIAPPLLKEKKFGNVLDHLKFNSLESREVFSFLLVSVVVFIGVWGIFTTFSSSFAYTWPGVPYVGAVIYAIYLIESIASPISRQLQKLMKEERGYDMYLQARQLAPSFYWHSESYHYETRTVTTTVSDGRGGTTTTTTTVEVRVTTHVASMYYQFDDWIDVSDNFPINVGIFRVDSSNQYNFHDEYTRQDYDFSYQNFKVSNDRDTHQTCTSSFRIGGKTDSALPKMLLYTEQIPYFLRYSYYICAVLLLMGPWYRWFVTSIAENKKVDITKRIRKINPAAPSNDILLRWGNEG